MRIGKDVVEEQRTVDVPVTREEVFIERRPVERHEADAGTIGDSNETIRVPVHEEKVSIDKRAVVTEEIRVRESARSRIPSRCLAPCAAKKHVCSRMAI